MRATAVPVTLWPAACTQGGGRVVIGQVGPYNMRVAAVSVTL